MKKKPEPKLTARQVASMDITEDCRQERIRLKLSPSDPMGPQNCLNFEEAIREYAGVESKPDFRKFNGGWNRWSGSDSSYVTYRINGKAYAIRCKTEAQANECLSLVRSIPETFNARINLTSEFRGIKREIINYEDFKNMMEL